MSVPNPGSVTFAKVPHFDPVTVVKKPGVLVQKSSTSLTNQSYSASTQTGSRVNFSINLPKGTFIDRRIIFEADLYVDFKVTIDRTEVGSFPNPTANSLQFNVAAGAAAADRGYVTVTPVVALGKDLALRPYPFHKLVNTTSLRLGSETFTQDTQEFTDTYDLLLEASSKKKPNNMIGPTNVCKFAINQGTDGFATTKNAMGHCYSNANQDSMNNGEYYDIEFLDGQTNAPLDVLSVANFRATGTAPGLVLFQRNGIPILTNTANNNTLQAEYNLRVKIHIREFVRIPPLCFNPCSEQMTGLWNIDTFNLDYQLLTSQVQRMFYTSRNGTPGFQRRIFSDFALATNEPIRNATLQIKMHQPPLSLEIPKEVIIPYFHELQQIYTQASGLDNAKNTTFTFTSQPQQISQIPHMVWVSVQPAQYQGRVGDTGDAIALPANGDYNNWYLPIESVQVRFDSSPSLLTNLTKDQLFEITNKNGVHVSRDVYNGSCYGSTYMSIKQQTLGSGVLLSFGDDICLPEDLAPGVNGSFTFSIAVTVRTPSVMWSPDVMYPQIAHATSNAQVTPGTAGDGITVAGTIGEIVQGYTPGAAQNSEFKLTDLRLKLQYFTKQYLAIDGNGQTVKMNGQVTKEDALKASLGPRQMDNMVDYESVGGGFFDKIKKGFNTASNVWKQIPGPLKDMATNAAKQYVTKGMMGKGSASSSGGGYASRTGGNKGKKGTKRMLTEMY